MAENLVVNGVTYPNVAVVEMTNEGGDTVCFYPNGGGVPAVEKDVNFYDYDGTLLYSYTLDEMQRLTELPSGSKHDGLVFDGWNWTLADLKEYAKPMDVGAHYITDDGKTRLHLHLTSETHLSVPLCISQSQANGVTINWGDGSAEEKSAIRWANTIVHEYPSPGDYVITLAVTNGYLDLGLGYHYQSVIGGSSNAEGSMAKLYYKNSLRKVELGRGVNGLTARSFYCCMGLETVSVPAGVPITGNNVFAECRRLRFLTCQGPQSALSMVFGSCTGLERVSLSKGAYLGDNFFSGCSSLKKLRACLATEGTGFRAYMFNSCHTLEEAEIPAGQTVISDSTFRNAYSLRTATIPAGVQTIEANAFAGCFALCEIHLLPTTPPTLANTNAFTSLPADCVIYVPKGCLSAYQTATNWSTYASQMREEEA